VTPYYEQDGITIWHADCREILPVTADVLVTDPPYGLGDRWTGGKARWPMHHGQMGWDAVPFDGLAELIADTPAVVWGGHLYPLSISRGWLTWDKKQNDEFTSGQAELAWTTLDQPIRTFRMSQVEAYCNPRDPKFHPTQKPIALMKWCLEFFPEVRTVLDPFMGSGTTLVAAKQLGRRAIGIEIEERYCEIAAKRLAQGVLDLSA
jgi:site-specific DNA-methyltransferase (adenine-specific)